MSLTRSTPARRNAAPYTSSAPASEPVCVAAAFAAMRERPDFITMTGLTRAAARAADMNALASPMASTYMRMARVAGSMANQSSRSSKSTSAMSPTETRPEKPTLRSAAKASSDTVTAPDWEMTARSPGIALSAAKLASRPARGASTPRQLGPTMRMGVRWARSRICARSESSPWPGSAVMTIATGTPIAAASSASAATWSRGAAITARSGISGRSESRAAQGSPSIWVWRGLTR